MRKRVVTCLSLLAFFTNAYSQTSTNELYLTVNTNMQLPIATPHKGVYPILWYDKETDPKILIGGFGVGVANVRSVTPGLTMKAEANLSRHVYWDEPNFFKDMSNNPIAVFQAASVDYALGLGATAMLPITERFSVGAGLGAQVLLLSYTRQSNISASAKPVENTLIANKHYKPFVPVLPVEITYRSKRKMYNIRYEQALLNRHRNELKDARQDLFGILSFELGFRLGASE